MSKPITVGLTGGIGSGKTLISNIFSIIGVPIYNADNRAKVLMNTTLTNSITKAFGAGSYINGKLNRFFIANQVFKDKGKLDILNAIVHPSVALDFESWVHTHSKANYVIKEAALLLESGSAKLLDQLIVVTSPIALRVARIKVRDVFRSQEEIEGIINSQTSDEYKEKLANFIIKNNESQLLIPQVLGIDKRIRQR